MLQRIIKLQNERKIIVNYRFFSVHSLVLGKKSHIYTYIYISPPLVNLKIKKKHTPYIIVNQ